MEDLHRQNVNVMASNLTGQVRKKLPKCHGCRQWRFVAQIKGPSRGNPRMKKPNTMVDQ